MSETELDVPLVLKDYPASTELVYRLLACHGESTIPELEGVTCCPRPTIWRSLQRLESEGLVTRRPDPCHPSRERWRLDNETEADV